LDWYFYPLIIAAGFAAGFINTVAGSGSLITLPLLIFFGLPANVANGTNRVAILLQNIVGVSSFRQQKVLNFKHGLILAIPAAIGGIIGAQIAVDLNEEVMRRVIGGLMVFMFIVILVKPKRWLIGKSENLNRNPSWLQMLIFFGIGIYGGFIQAGVGIFLLAGLVLGVGYDIVKANAVKLLIVLCFTIFALYVFYINDQVNWFVGIILALGNMSGAWIASRMSVKKGANFVRWFLIVVVAFSAVYLLGVFEIFK